MGSNFIRAIAENYVTQQLNWNGYDLNYWQSKYTTEVDFVLQSSPWIIGVEVKAGKNTKSKSLSEFICRNEKAKTYKLS